MGDYISVTGQGIICAIGNDLGQVLHSLRGGVSGVGPMRYLQTVHSDLPVGEVKLSNDSMKAMLGLPREYVCSRTSLLGAIAIRQALAQAGIESVSGKRTVLISGTTVGNMDVTEIYFERMKTDDGLLRLPHSSECGESTLEMARLSGLEEADVCTISTACSSALNSIIVGCEMLLRDEADIIIAGGSEALSRFHLNGFNTLMILDKERCRPFDRSRQGLNLGEGAAFVVLQKNVPGAQAYVKGYGNRCDAFHQTASSENGDGAYLAMKEALDMSGLLPGDVQYVNAHGTGTPNNDRSESQALKRIFGGHMPEVSSTKAFTGHTTSASGSIETVISTLAMQNSFTPGNLGWESSDEDCIAPTPGHNGVKLENVMCNSFGFGGNDSSIIIGSEPHFFNVTSESRYDSRVAVQMTVTSQDDLSALKEYIPPLELRRMGKLSRAAFLASLRAMRLAGVEVPDAIVAATSRGMLDISQEFLNDINANGEQLLKPTLFMQSTHNTIGSGIAIRTHCYGYNITYSQGDKSEEWAMRDAERLIRSGRASTVLVVSFDETTPVFDSFCIRSGSQPQVDLYAKTVILKSVLK